MLSKRQTFRLIFSLGLLGLIGLTWILPTQAAQGPTAITLDYFEGFWDGEIVELEWGTGTELGTQGFEVMRAESSTQPANQDDGFEVIVVEVEGELYGPGFISLIPPSGTGITGGDYLAFDADVDPETTYWYILVEYESGSPTVYDAPDEMVRVDTMAGTPTPTPSGLGGGSGNTTPTPTMTPQPSNTPQPTATQTNNGGGGSGPSPTPESTRQGAATPTNAAPQPTSTGGFSGASAGPTATLANSSLPGGSSGDSGAIAQITPTSEPGSYPDPGGLPVENTAGTAEAYPDGLVPTATAYPISEINGQSNGTDNGATGNGTIPNNGFPSTVDGQAGNNVSSNDFLNGSDAQQGETQSRERLLLWIGFIAAMLVFAGGMFGSIILFTRQRA